MNLESLVLNPTDMLVEKVSDYLTKTEKGKLNTSVALDAKFDVGIIHKVGESLPKEWESKILYYHKSLGNQIDVKGIGNFELVNDSSKLMVRLDKNKNNY